MVNGDILERLFAIDNPANWSSTIVAKVSIKQIAEATKLSPVTVSIVLNGRGDEMRIAHATQNRIWDVARQFGYKPNIYARRLRQQSGKEDETIIGVLWPSLYSGERLIRFFDGIQRAILKENLNIEVIYKPYVFGEIAQIEDVFRRNPFNGLIVVGASNEDAEFIRKVSCHMPIVFFARQDNMFYSVDIDEFGAGEKVASLFAARGHQQAGLLEADIPTRSSILRRAGFLSGCKRLGLSVLPEAISAGRLDEMKAATSQMLARCRPTAVFLSIGITAPSVYEAFDQAGVRIPADVELLGYGDTQFNPILKPSLSVIDAPLEDMVLDCLNLILDIINGRSVRAMSIFLEPRFIFRDSCGGFPDSPPKDIVQPQTLS
jgi:DNA-binding LacI/PurR family transcriptional regulator